MNLRDLQRAFQAHVLRGDAPVEPWIESAAGLGVYIDAYRLRLVEALGKDFPVLKAHLGADAFARAIGDYLAARPPRHYSIRYAGADLAAFLRNNAPYAAAPALAELAALDWALLHAFDAAAAALVTEAELARTAPEAWPALRFGLHPSVSVLALSSNAPALWQAHARAEPLPTPVATGGAHWLVWRRDLQVYFRRLVAHEHDALAGVARGECFGEICDMLNRALPAGEVAGAAASLLKTWLVEGLLIQPDG